MELENKIINNVEIEKQQENFFDTMFGKVINNGIDFGLRAILPDVIENQVIDIKDSLIQNGIKDGIKTATNSIIDLSKSTTGIFTGKFENMSQVQTAIGSGGVVDTISNLLDKAINKTYELGIFNSTVKSLIKNGKNVIVNSIKSNLKEEIKNQEKSLEDLETCIDKWKKYYNNKDFDGMSKEYNNIEKKMKDIIPIENLIKEARKVENIHNLVKNNGLNFDITQDEVKLAENLV